MSKTVELLRQAGVKADDYIRGPLGKESFAISIRPVGNTGTVKVWEGQASIKVFGDEEKQQAVLWVDEADRDLTRIVSFYSHQQDSTQSTRAKAIDQFRRAVSVPRESQTEFTVSDIKYPKNTQVYLDSKTKQRKTRRIRTSGTGTAKVTCRAKGSKNTLLLGMDETYHFIAALPKRAESVVEAHGILRPTLQKEDGVLRQGEWFFEPVEEEMSLKLDDIASRHGRLNQRRLGSTTHSAMQAIIENGVTYAVGYIIDSRSSHHDPLWLPGWHKVIKNREQEMRINRTDLRPMALRRTWD